MFSLPIIAPPPMFENYSKSAVKIKLKPVNNGFDARIYREMGRF